MLIRKQMIVKALKQKPVQGKRHLEPFKKWMLAKKLPFSILEDSEVPGAEPELHKHEGDLWCCLEGTVKFVIGGKIVKPFVRKGYNGNEMGGEKIVGGKAIFLKPGDWLWIPPTHPHMHTCSETARMIIIKIPKK